MILRQEGDLGSIIYKLVDISTTVVTYFRQFLEQKQLNMCVKWLS